MQNPKLEVLTPSKSQLIFIGACDMEIDYACTMVPKAEERVKYAPKPVSVHAEI